MMEINLLPDSFQSTQEAKRLPTLHVLVVVAVLVVIGIAETTRRLNTRDLASELETVGATFIQARQQVQNLSHLTQKLHRRQFDAALGVSLVHPLSRSRILAELGRRCPADIRINSLKVSTHQPAMQVSAPHTGQPHAKPRRAPARAPHAKQASPDVSPQQALMAEADCDAQAVIEGAAAQIADVHQYLQRLEEFAEVKLDAINKSDDLFQFRMIATVRSSPLTSEAARP